MMEFKCTEYSIPSEKIQIIGNEVMKQYPNLQKTEIMKISAICDSVPNKVDEDIKFRRFYHILWIIGKENPNYDDIYEDMLSICSNKIKDELNICIFNDLVKFQNGELDSFPSIDKYYTDNIDNVKKYKISENYTEDIFKTKKIIKEKTEEIIETNLPIEIKPENSIFSKIKNFFKNLFSK